MSARAIYDEQPWIEMIIVPRDVDPRGDPGMSATTSRRPATATMISLIGSLADNKSRARAPVRRVGGERADDRVGGGGRGDGPGRARPRALDLPDAGQARRRARGRGRWTAGHPLPVIDAELPDWASFIAANLVVDGILTTFVATARDSSIEPLAQRARKILQEEGAHKVHAEAWARRIVPRRRRGLELLRQRIEEMWARPRAGPGPTIDPGLPRRRSRPGWSVEGPAAIRERVRDWLQCARSPAS